MPAERAAAVFALPAPPPIGTKLGDDQGNVWQVIDRAAEEPHPLLTTVRDEHDDRPVMTREWHVLLAESPLTLLQLTDQEQELARLYGPPGARWGNPDEPCHNIVCALGTGHAGPHVDSAGEPVPALFRDEEPSIGIDTRPCTCGNHSSHEPTCPRYTGGTTLDAELAKLRTIAPGGFLAAVQRAVPTTNVPDLCGAPNMPEDADEWRALPAGHEGPHDPHAAPDDAPWGKLESGPIGQRVPMISRPGHADDDEGPGGDRE
jgi:hypothetical protein